MKTNLTLRRRVQQLAAAGMTQNEIAKEVGKTQAYVSVIIRELRSRYYLAVLERLAQRAPDVLKSAGGMTDHEVQCLQEGMWKPGR